MSCDICVRPRGEVLCSPPTASTSCSHTWCFACRALRVSFCVSNVSEHVTAVHSAHTHLHVFQEMERAVSRRKGSPGLRGSSPNQDIRRSFMPLSASVGTKFTALQKANLNLAVANWVAGSKTTLPFGVGKEQRVRHCLLYQPKT